VQSAIVRASNLEKAKSRLQAELEITIIELDKVKNS
jgi:thioester reductase-like protein